MKKRIVKNLCLLLVLLIGAMAALSGACGAAASRLSE